jgi:hypothetical protein
MIHNQELIDHPNVRALAKKIAEIPGVLTVRWFPPFKQSQVDLLGDGGMLFKIVLHPTADDVYPEFAQQVSKPGWDNVDAHLSTIGVIVDNIQKLQSGQV